MLTTQKNFDVFALDEASPEAARALATPQVPQLIEKIFTDQHGRTFRMVFIVAVVDGELKGKLVSVQPISAASHKLNGAISSGIICLPIERSTKKGETVYVADFAPVVSPYVSLESLITSQPTRAPSK
ncbi:MAG: hypothetical protein V4481_04720 [Patescibacteria group bacterium]